MQKNSLKLHLLRKKGISLIVSVVVSFFVLAMTMAILVSVNKSLQSAVGLERFNQATFAAEAGMEAAFFHHNARGQGVHFGDVTSVGSDQTISFPDGDVQWSILGRTDDQGLTSNRVLTGVLLEDQTVTIPLYFDNTASVGENPNTISNGFADIENDFELRFGRYLFSPNGSVSSDSYIDLNFDFAADENDPVINWSLSRFNDDEKLQTFIPMSILDQGRLNCEKGNTYFPLSTGYVCRDHLSGLGSSSYVSVNTTQAIMGKILPGDNQATLNQFVNGSDLYVGSGSNNERKFTLNFRPLMPFEDIDGNKIKGIPWAIVMQSLPGTAAGIPKPYYEAEVLAVDQNNYRRYVRTTIMEETAVGVLDVLTLE